MKPDRSNYEIWFTDSVDGKLNSQQAEELNLFLQENPDLREEFEALTIVTLKPTNDVFTGKEGIRRSLNSLSPEQFEHLCIAYHENDLNAGQISELMEITENDPLKRKTFELAGKLKLKPPDLIYSGKNRLRKLTTGMKIFRLVATGLSMAASIAILITVYFTMQGKPDENKAQSAINSKVDSLLIRSVSPIVALNQPIAEEAARQTSDTGNTVERSPSPDLYMVIAEPESPITDVDSSVSIERVMAVTRAEILVPTSLFNLEEPYATRLIAYNEENLPPFFDDGRSNVERFFARIFHEKILKDPLSGDKPVESFEIAEAGIAGLNKLFGWEIALQKNVNDIGEIKSYYFNSKLLKFNAPVKKTAEEL